MVISTAENTVISERSLDSTIKRIVKVTENKPLAVICTGLDKHHNESDDDSDEEQAYWKTDDTMELCDWIFGNTSLAMQRIQFSSPPMYRSAQFLMEQLEAVVQLNGSKTSNGSKLLDYAEMKKGGGKKVGILKDRY